MVENLISILVGFVVFNFWLAVVGNPHVVETVIGLIIAIAAGVYFRFRVVPSLTNKINSVLSKIKSVLEKFFTPPKK